MNTDSSHHTKVIVVLGMHRSGTSAVTRGLLALGVSLGDNLTQASRDNVKGFWEDREVVAIDDEILARLGMCWHSIGHTPNAQEWESLLASDVAVRAEAHVRAQIRRYPLWGVKDPRIPRLLPFWRAIFARCDVNPFFVVIARDPRSVAASLARRNGFPFAYSCQLWLDHLLPSLLLTSPEERVIADYDQLLEQPVGELKRISRALDLSPLSDQVLGDYTTGFLDKNLRNHSGKAERDTDVPALPAAVKEAFDIIGALAAGRENGSEKTRLLTLNAQQQGQRELLQMASEEHLARYYAERELQRIRRSPIRNLFRNLLREKLGLRSQRSPLTQGASGKRSDSPRPTA